MASSNQILFSLLLFEIVLFPLIGSAFTIPNVKDPVTDLLPGNLAGSSPGSGTGQGPTSDTVSPGTQAIQSCVVGGTIGAGTGAVTGGIIGLAFFGVGAIPGAVIGGLVGGGALGCGIAGIFFPQQGSAAFTSASNTFPVLGDFLKALVVAISYFGPLLTFLSDSATYEFALLSVAPEIGVFLFPLQAITLIWGFYTIALYLRGVGLGT
jgi:hypothetical protein